MAEKNTKRRIEEIIEKDLQKKMVLLAGPRQCGKTTVAQKLLKQIGGSYYNWDNDLHRKAITQNNLNHDAKLWVFDELHKYKYWRNWLKGNYDTYKDSKSILVTGSAKLDYYSRGGDSLQGRYYFHRLHPFTVSELSGLKFSSTLESFNNLEFNTNNLELDTLMDFGGFPEPLFSGSMAETKRWRASYTSRLVREDIRDLELVKDIDKMEILSDHLPKTVGSVLSINSLREDLEVSHGAVKNWLDIFEKNYLCFRVPPFGAPKIKAVKKEQKLYFWDWGMVEDEAARFENLVAVHLLRFCHYALDVWGEKLELKYFRDTLKREVDFIILKDKKPWMAIECKLTDDNLDTNLKYLLERSKFPHAYQLTRKTGVHKVVPEINSCKIKIVSADRFLGVLP